MPNSALRKGRAWQTGLAPLGLYIVLPSACPEGLSKETRPFREVRDVNQDPPAVAAPQGFFQADSLDFSKLKFCHWPAISLRQKIWNQFSQWGHG